MSLSSSGGYAVVVSPSTKPAMIYSTPSLECFDSFSTPVMPEYASD
jgi:hypothetical protein